jgi:hypothetical protein
MLMRGRGSRVQAVEQYDRDAGSPLDWPVWVDLEAFWVPLMTAPLGLTIPCPVV